MKSKPGWTPWILNGILEWIVAHLCRKSSRDVWHGGGVGGQGKMSQTTIFQQQPLCLNVITMLGTEMICTSMHHCWVYKTKRCKTEHFFSLLYCINACLKLPLSQKCVFVLLLQLNVLVSLCRTMYLQSLALLGWFHFHCCTYIFSVYNKVWILRGLPMRTFVTK